MMTTKRPVLWTAEQVCSECGEGVFEPTGNIDNPIALCSVCGHEHPLDPWNLGEGERFVWQVPTGSRARWADRGTTLHVIAYDVTEEGE